MLASNGRPVQPLMSHFLPLGWLTFVRMVDTIIRLQGGDEFYFQRLPESHPDHHGPALPFLLSHDAGNEAQQCVEAGRGLGENLGAWGRHILPAIVTGSAAITSYGLTISRLRARVAAERFPYERGEHDPEMERCGCGRYIAFIGFLSAGLGCARAANGGATGPKSHGAIRSNPENKDGGRSLQEHQGSERHSRLRIDSQHGVYFGVTRCAL
jgi:hypothetical protein